MYKKDKRMGMFQISSYEITSPRITHLIKRVYLIINVRYVHVLNVEDLHFSFYLEGKFDAFHFLWKYCHVSSYPTCFASIFL